ncbi:lactonase family protein [Ruania zhangjianzhongii]|uniref:lactonase family protein n=1 Tax=Ruania zhangjianzhongii TaxID=2603206 RepID=UPI00143D26DF|nr:beta-propeller fold lactonase family protein [Ruania zhangjianzhongii]
MNTLRQFWIGTKAQDNSSGIWRFQRESGSSWSEVTAKLMAVAPMPTFLAVHPHAERLYAVGEGKRGGVASYDVGTDCTLHRTGTVASGGQGPCHLLVHPQGHWVYVANYGDGTLGAIELTEAGNVDEHVRTYTHSGSGPVADRQERSHAHFCALSPGGDWLIVTDLGTDELRAYPLDDGLPEDEPVLTQLPAGFGPRHLAMAGEHVYVAGELSGEVATLAWDEGTGQGEVLHQEPASVAEGLHQLSHIERAGDRLFVGVRGADTLATLGDRRGRCQHYAARRGRHRRLAAPPQRRRRRCAGGRRERRRRCRAPDRRRAGTRGDTEEIAVPGPMCVLPM